jgi:hypothetical protein
MCAATVFSDSVGYATDILETLGKGIPYAQVNMGPALTTPLEAGMQAFEDALALTKW